MLEPYDKPLENFGYPFRSEVEPSKKFIKIIEKGLPRNGNASSIALKLYNNLNERVVYSEEVLALDQDLDIDFIRKIYDLPISAINLNNREVTCNSWAKLYCFFLQRHNIPCVINNAKHRSVYLKADGHLFNADATNLSLNPHEKSKMNDLTRSELGLRPCGFKAYVKDEDGFVDFVNIYDLKINLAAEVKRDFVSLPDRTDKIVKELLNCSSFKIRKLPELTDEIIDSFSLINKLVVNENITNTSVVPYVNNLIKILFSPEDQKHLAYIKVRRQEKEEYKFYQLINYCPTRKESRNYGFLLLNSLEGYNFLCKNDGLEYFKENRAKKLIIDSQNLYMDIKSKGM